MNLGSIKTEGNFKALIFGSPGIGKTVFSCSFPGKTRFLDFDNKVDSAALFYKNKPEILENVDVTQFPSGLLLSPSYQLEKIINEEFIPQQKVGKMNFDTLVIDSMTTFSSATLQHIIKTNPGIKRVPSAQGVQPSQSDYGILKREFQRVIPGLISLPCNVIMLAHIALEKDELTGQITRHPNMDGSFAKELPIYFKEVWRAFMKDGKRYVQTQPDGLYDCRSQIPGLPNPVELNYEVIANYLK